MFCPRCGGPTTIRDGGLVCVSTETEFSQVVADELAGYVTLPPQDAHAASFRWGGRWFCPADATVMTERDGRVVCAACGRAMPSPLIYNVIEFHIHPAPSG